MKRLAIILSICLAATPHYAAWTSVGSLVAKANITAADPVNWTTTATLEAGNVAVCAIASDNDGNGTDTDDIVGVTYGTETMISVGENEYDNGTTAAGAVVGIYYLKAEGQQNSGVTVAVDMSASRTAHGLSCWEFTITAGNTVSSVGTEQKEDVTGDAGALTLGGLSDAGHLWVRAIASETTNASISTPSGGFSVFTSSTGSTGTAATSMGVAAEFIIATATTETSDPTMSASSDRASSMIALDEIAPVTSVTRRRILIAQ